MWKYNSEFYDVINRPQKLFQTIFETVSNIKYLIILIHYPFVNHLLRKIRLSYFLENGNFLVQFSLKNASHSHKLFTSKIRFILHMIGGGSKIRRFKNIYSFPSSIETFLVSLLLNKNLPTKPAPNDANKFNWNVIMDSLLDIINKVENMASHSKNAK